MTGGVGHIHRVVLAIREQVIALHISADAGKLTVRIDEPSHGRVIIPALEEVEPGFGWILLCTSGGEENFSPPGVFSGGYLLKQNAVYQQASCLDSHTLLVGIIPSPLRFQEFS